MYQNRQQKLKDEADKIQQSSKKEKSPICDYGFCLEEMQYLDMSPQDYKNYLRLRKLVFRMASCELMRVYFPQILFETEKIARFNDLPSSFLFFVNSLHVMKAEIDVQKDNY